MTSEVYGSPLCRKRKMTDDTMLKELHSHPEISSSGASLPRMSIEARQNTILMTYRVQFSEVLTLNSNSYEEKEAGSLDSKWDGLHTYNFDGNFEVIDALQTSLSVRRKLETLVGKARYFLSERLATSLPQSCSFHALDWIYDKFGEEFSICLTTAL